MWLAQRLEQEHAELTDIICDEDKEQEQDMLLFMEAPSVMDGCLCERWTWRSPITRHSDARLAGRAGRPVLREPAAPDRGSQQTSEGQAGADECGDRMREFVWRCVSE